MQDDFETEEPALPAASPAKEKLVKGTRQSFADVRRAFTEEEMSQSGTQKMLLDDLDRLESELAGAKGFQDRFYDEAKQVAVLKERFKTHTAVELMSTGAVTVGSLLCGGTFGTINGEDSQLELFILGGCLALVGLAAKAIKL